MTPKQYLLQYRRALWRIEVAKREIERARDRASGVRAILYSDMPKSQNVEHDLSDAIALIEKATERYKQVLKAQTAVLAEVAAVIDNVEDDTQSKILWFRFVEGWHFPDIASHLYLSDSWMYTQYNRGLDDVRHQLKERSETE